MAMGLALPERNGRTARRVLSWAVLGWLAAGLSLAEAGPSPLPPTGAVRIESLSIDAPPLLKAGARARAMLRGTAGGSATFSVCGVESDIAMRESRPGVYQAQPALYIGTYVAGEGDAARKAAVIASLAIRGTTVTSATDRLLTIDTRPPVVLARQPKPDSTQVNRRPNIVASLFEAETGIEPKNVRLLVNGRNVTRAATISENAVTYNPEAPFNPGRVRVELAAGDEAGNVLRTEWAFGIESPGELIQSVTINPTTALKLGDILTVVMSGARGGRASFSIEGLVSAVAMRESQQTPGVYFGTYAVRAGAGVLDAPIQVTLERSGRKATVAATALVTIVPRAPAVPTIAAPGRAVVLGDAPEERTILRGRTRAGHRIFGRITYVVSAPAQRTGILAEFSAIAGADGVWQAALGPCVPPEDARIVVTVLSEDAAGQRSGSATMELTPR